MLVAKKKNKEENPHLQRGEDVVMPHCGLACLH